MEETQTTQQEEETETTSMKQKNLRFLYNVIDAVKAAFDKNLEDSYLEYVEELDEIKKEDVHSSKD